MKVNHVDNLSGNLPPHVDQAEDPDGAEFKAILEQKMGAQPAEGGRESRPASAPEMIPEVDFRPVSMVDGQGLVQQVADFLDTLEAYQQKLMDPTASLKEISPLIDRLQAEGETLSGHLEALRPDDGLHDILSQALITSSLEVIRFNRGDYIA